MDKVEKVKTSKTNKQVSNMDTKNGNEQGDELHDNNISNGDNNNIQDSSISSNDSTSGKISYSNDFSVDLAILNEIGKASRIGMSSINNLITNISNSDLKKDVVAIYSQYSNILHQVSQHFEKYGEIPDETTIYNKIINFCGTKINTKFDNSNSHIAELMIQGTIMGIIQCTKIQNKKLPIESSTQNLLNDFTQFQKDNITKLSTYL